MTQGEWWEGETCIDCGEPLDHTGYPEDSEFIGEYRSGATYEQVREDGDVGHMCLYCREHWDEGANTLTLVHPDGYQTHVTYSGGIMFDHSMYDQEYIPVPDSPFEEVVLAIVAGTGWKSTDAWRGYEHGPSTADEWEKVTDTWHGTMTRTSASDAVNALAAGKGPTPVAVAFTTTSNVMSIGIEVYAPEYLVDEIEAHFSEATAGLDGGRF